MPRRPAPALPLLDHAARRAEEEAARVRAEAVLARQRQKKRAKAIALTLALEEEEKRTEALLREQAQTLERLKDDAQLEALLAARRAGRPIAEALAEVERRFPPKQADKPSADRPSRSSPG